MTWTVGRVVTHIEGSSYVRFAQSGGHVMIHAMGSSHVRSERTLAEKFEYDLAGPHEWFVDVDFFNISLGMGERGQFKLYNIKNN